MANKKAPAKWPGAYAGIGTLRLPDLRVVVAQCHAAWFMQHMMAMQQHNIENGIVLAMGSLFCLIPSIGMMTQWIQL
jgi:hypothetical protein